MPVTPEFSWNETDGVVRMEVKLTSATSFTDNDVVASDVFVKVNCPPYLLQLDLFGYVDPEKTEVTVNKPCIKFLARSSKKIFQNIASDFAQGAVPTKPFYKPKNT